MSGISLAMIVRDAEGTLAACLESAKPWVDEIVIGDTGSQDGTRELARQAGAQVFDVAWSDDFSAARNAVLERVHGDWVLVLDADEMLQVPSRARWQRQLAGSADAFQFTIRNYVHSLEHRVWDRAARPNDGACAAAAGLPGFVEHQNVRLFRHHPELYFVGRVHESVGPRVLAAGLRLAEAHGVIHHFGLVLPPARIAAKNRYYRDLGRQKVAEQPNNAQAHFELGLVELDNFHAYGEAVQCFAQACRLQPDFGLAWFFAGVALLRLDGESGERAEAALQLFEQAAKAGYRSPLLSESTADALYSLQRFDEAATAYRRAGRGGSTPALDSKRALAELRAGHKGALARLRQARDRAPETAEIHDRLVAACVWLDDLSGALAAARERLRQLPNEAASYLRVAALLQRMERPTEAQEVLARGLARLPEHQGLRRAADETARNQFEPGLKPRWSTADTPPEWNKPVVADVELPSSFPAG